MKRSKAYRAAAALADADQNYSPEEAIALAKQNTLGIVNSCRIVSGVAKRAYYLISILDNASILAVYQV